MLLALLTRQQQLRQVAQVRLQERVDSLAGPQAEQELVPCLVLVEQQRAVAVKPQEKQVQQTEPLLEKQLQVELLQLVALVQVQQRADVRLEDSVRVLVPAVALQPSSLIHKLSLASSRTVSLLLLEAHQTSKIQISVAHSLLVHQYSVSLRVLEVLEEDLAVAQEQAVLEPADSVAVAHEVLLLLQLQLHNFAPLIRGAMIH